METFQRYLGGFGRYYRQRGGSGRIQYGQFDVWYNLNLRDEPSKRQTSRLGGLEQDAGSKYGGPAWRWDYDFLLKRFSSDV